MLFFTNFIRFGDFLLLIDLLLLPQVEGSVTAGSIASEEEDDYNTVMVDQEEYDKDNVDQIGAERTLSLYKSCVGNGYNSTIQEPPPTPAIDHDVPLTNVVDEINTKLYHDGFPDEFPTGEEYRKLLHGRSKSLSITFNQCLYRSRKKE